MSNDYEIGFEDGRMGLYLPGTRAGQHLENYVRGNQHGAEARSKRLLGDDVTIIDPNQKVQPPDYLVNAAGAIQHAVTVTRPDPSRVEMAMHLYPHVLASAEACVLRGEASFSPDWREQTAAEAVKQADALIAALEKPRP